MKSKYLLCTEVWEPEVESGTSIDTHKLWDHLHMCCKIAGQYYYCHYDRFLVF